MPVPPSNLPRRRWLAALLGALPAPAPAADSAVAVIVAPSHRLTTLSADELAQIYRRQKQFVAGGRVQPVNLPASHGLRRWFSQQVLGQSPEELEGYWRDQYFNGTVPPFVLASEEAVIRFVASTPGALGYVSACSLDKRVRVLMQWDNGPACTR